jgi:hypothetical protein
VPLTYRREGVNHQIRLRLPGVHDPAQLIDMIQEQQLEPITPPEGEKPSKEKEGEEPAEKPGSQLPKQLLEMLKRKQQVPAAVAARYEAVRGYANYWYNRDKQQQLWDTYRDENHLERVPQPWRIVGQLADHEPFHLTVGPTRGEIRLPTGQSGALFSGDLSTELSPPGSGGLLLALHLWQRMLEKGLAQFGEVYYLGQLPVGRDGEMVDCLVGLHEGLEFRMLFSLKDGNLVGLELFPRDDIDPCVVHFSDFQEIAGKRLPMRWLVSLADREFADMHISEWQFGEPAEKTGEETH